MSARRIAYVQFTNPTDYPPLVHSAHILAEQGWEVLFLGVASFGTGRQEVEPHPRIRVELIEGSDNPKVAYPAYAGHVLRQLVRFRPDVLYASDLWSCPIAAACSAGRSKIIYHEHDEPQNRRSAGVRLSLAARRYIAPRAAVCVLPNARRAERFVSQLPGARTAIVWNCPQRREVAPPRQQRPAAPFRLYYHGSLVPERLPRSAIYALAELPDVRLRILGFQTLGAQGYVPELQELARSLGAGDRLEVRSTRARHHIWPELDDCDAGLALVPMQSADINLETMAGASNKPFDYLARGLALITSARADWQSLYGDYGTSCDPGDVPSLASAIRQLAADRAATRAMGEQGRQRVLQEWNYEHQFEPVQRIIND